MRTPRVTSSRKSILALMLVFLCFSAASAVAPEIHSVQPDHGAQNSPTDITIHGDNFEATTTVALYGGGPYIVGSVSLPDYALGVFVSGNYAYVTDSSSALQIVVELH